MQQILGLRALGVRYFSAAFGALDASFWKRGSFRSGSNIGSSRSSAGVSGGICPKSFRSIVSARARRRFSRSADRRGVRRNQDRGATRFTIERPRSGLQLELMEFLRRRAEVAKMVNGRAGWREGERRKRFLEHFVEVGPRGEAGGDVRMVMLAGMLRHELRNVGDQLREDLGVFGCSDECGRGAGFHRERD